MKKIITTDHICLEDFAREPKEWANTLEIFNHVAEQLTAAIKHWDARLAVTFKNPPDRMKNPRGTLGHFQIEQDLK